MTVERKDVVVRKCVGDDEEFSDVPGVLSVEQGDLYIFVESNDISIAIPLGSIVDTLKEELESRP